MFDEIKKMPKVELHLHLDGSLSIPLACELSGLNLYEVKEKMVAPLKCYNLGDYLTKFEFPISLMQSKYNLKLITRDLLNRLALENVIYLELRFCPLFHTKGALTCDEVVETVLEETLNSKIKVNLILCLMRGNSWKENFKVFKCALKYLNKGVCAIDLAGDEGKYSLEMYSEFFKLAKYYNVPFTIHAGEVKCDEVEKALELNADRLGHGIMAINNLKVLHELKKRNVLLEVCPTSNVQTNIVSDYQNHPIKQLFDENVLISVNTDNSSVSNITLTDEYIKLYENFHFTLDDFYKMNINALNHSFLNDDEKSELLQKFK